MLQDYSRYILNIRNSLLQCGISFDSIEVDETDYYEIFKLALRLDDILELYRALVFSSSMQEIFIPVDDLYALYVKSESLKEFQEDILPGLREQHGDTESPVNLQLLLGLDDEPDSFEAQDLVDSDDEEEEEIQLGESDFIDLFDDDTEQEVQPINNSVNAVQPPKSYEDFGVPVFMPVIPPVETVEYTVSGKSILDCNVVSAKKPKATPAKPSAQDEVIYVSTGKSILNCEAIPKNSVNRLVEGTSADDTFEDDSEFGLTGYSDDDDSDGYEDDENFGLSGYSEEDSEDTDGLGGYYGESEGEYDGEAVDPEDDDFGLGGYSSPDDPDDSDASGDSDDEEFGLGGYSDEEEEEDVFEGDSDDDLGLGGYSDEEEDAGFEGDSDDDLGLGGYEDSDDDFEDEEFSGDSEDDLGLGGYNTSEEESDFSVQENTTPASKVSNSAVKQPIVEDKDVVDKWSDRFGELLTGAKRLWTNRRTPKE